MKKIACLLLLLAPAVLHAGDDWPQWLGPQRNGSTPEKIFPWKTPLKILWKQAVGEGHSSPVVADGRMFLHTLKDKTEEELTAYDAESGKVLWSKSYDRGSFTALFGNGPRGTPAVVDGKVYTYGITGLLTCFDAKTGQQNWQLDLLKEFKANNLFFGAACSPLVVGDKVIVNVGGKDSSIVAVDKENGKVIWHKLDDKASYSSGITVQSGGSLQVIFLTAKGLVSLAPKDGKLLWQHPLVDALFESSTTPVLIGDVLFASSVTFGGLALKISETPDGPAVKQIWMKPELNCYFSTPVAVGKEHLYIVTSTKPLTKAKMTSTFRCIEAETGKEMWNRPNVGVYHASMVRTGDGKLLLLEEAGNLVLVDADPTQYKELARSKICGETWAHPALANGRLYIRDKKEVVCVQMSQ